MSALAKNYNRRKISFKKGKGSFLYSTERKKYLDELKDCATSHKLNHLILDDKGIASSFPFLNFSQHMIAFVSSESKEFVPLKR